MKVQKNSQQQRLICRTQIVTYSKSNAVRTRSRFIRQKHLRRKYERYIERFLSNLLNIKQKTSAKKSFENWGETLPRLASAYRNTERKDLFDTWIKKHFVQADANKNGALSINECTRLLKQMNKELPTKEIREYFEEACSQRVFIDGKRALDRDDVVTFFNSIPQRGEIGEIFSKYSTDGLMSAQDLQRFLRIEQNENYILEECQKFIGTFGDGGKSFKEAEHLRVLNFESFLLSRQDILDQAHRHISQDMNRPLNEYFIASSHNTYLLSHQLLGCSSVEGYINALKRGCRCVELDVWDGTPGCGQPVVFHGYSLVTKILLTDVLKAIKDHAFVVNPYPVIMSIENHCSPEYQVIMAKLFREILGDFLCADPIVGDLEKLPSPNDLRFKLLIKCKKLDPEPLSDDTEKGDDAVVPDKSASGSSDTVNEAGISGTSNTSNVERDSSLRGRYAKRSNRRSSTKKKKNENIAQEFSDVVNYIVATPFKSFEDTEHWEVNQMTSFNESKCYSFFTSDKNTSEVLAYCRKYIARIYPKGTRASSTNFDPIPFFNLGCQIVALNYQTSDKHLFYNSAMFSQNGKCGYVLKPTILRDGYDFRNPPSCLKKRYTIRIISGQLLPKPNESLEGEIVDPYVVMKTLGHKSDKNKFSTRFVSNNGFDPFWDEEFSFTVNVPDLAFLVFQVRDDAKTGKNYLLGRYAIPMTAMATGYRHVHLRNQSFQRIIPATLFVHVAIEDCI